MLLGADRTRDSIIFSYHLTLGKVFALIPMMYTWKSVLSKGYVLFFYAPFIVSAAYYYNMWTDLVTKGHISIPMFMSLCVVTTLHWLLMIIQLYGAVMSEWYWKKLIRNLSRHDESLSNVHFTDVHLKPRVYLFGPFYMLAISITAYGFSVSGWRNLSIPMISFRIEQVVILIQSLIFATIIYDLCDLIERRYNSLTHVVARCLGTSKEIDHVKYKVRRAKSLYYLLHGMVEQFNNIFGAYMVVTFFDSFANITLAVEFLSKSYSRRRCGESCWEVAQIVIKWVSPN
ncbi:hypothetical protein JTB14_000022 [Gonioctena quinquepunctata]|nr:hypothetical protein JTB14_000022 [Gonioctena quinquepunctata]